MGEDSFPERKITAEYRGTTWTIQMYTWPVKGSIDSFNHSIAFTTPSNGEDTGIMVPAEVVLAAFRQFYGTMTQLLDEDEILDMAVEKAATVLRDLGLPVDTPTLRVGASSMLGLVKHQKLADNPAAK